MKTFKNIITLGVFLLMLTPIISKAQNCHNFHKSNCLTSGNSYFNYNGQSKSALFRKGSTSELHIIIYKGQDYRISFCAESELGDKIEFKLKASETNKVFYDNAEDDYAQDFEFSCANTRKLTIEITIPAEESVEFKPRDMACLGVLIESMATPVSGF